MPRIVAHLLLLATAWEPVVGYYPRGFGISHKQKHEWSYEEFVRHKEEGYHPSAVLGEYHETIMKALEHPDAAQHIKKLKSQEPPLQDHHYEFQAKEEHEKR